MMVRFCMASTLCSVAVDSYLVSFKFRHKYLVNLCFSLFYSFVIFFFSIVRQTMYSATTVRIAAIQCLHDLG